MLKSLKTYYNSFKYKEYIQVLKDYSEKRRKKCEKMKANNDIINQFNSFQNHDVLQLECLVQEILQQFSKSKSTVEGFYQLSKSNSIEADLLSDSTGFGNILKVNRFFNLMSEDLFVLKYAKEDELITVLHETIIGLMLNELRKTTAVFTYVFGGFFCSIQEEKIKGTSKINICTLDSPTKLLLINEKINGESFEKWASKRSDGVDLFKIIVQIVFALSIAQQKFNFSHNDIHSENIMILDIGKYELFRYSISSSSGHKNIEIYTRYFPKIIDYGLSRANVKYRKIDSDYFNLRSGPKAKAEFETKLANISDCIKALGEDNILCLEDKHKDYCPLYDIIRLWLTCCNISNHIENFEAVKPFAEALYGGEISYNTDWMNNLCLDYISTQHQPLKNFIFGPMMTTFFKYGATNNNSFDISRLNNGEKFNSANAKRILNLILFDAKGRLKNNVRNMLESVGDEVDAEFKPDTY